VSPDDFPADAFSTDQLEFLLSYAILAPSSHNAQPWLFQLHTMHADVYADRRRSTRVVDPYDRELTMSCGAALYNVRVAGEYFGHQCKVELAPEPNNPHLLARFNLGLRCETTSEDILLFNAIPRRRTNRQPFRPDPVPEELVNALYTQVQPEGAWVQFIPTEEARYGLAELVARADAIQWANSQRRSELAKWVRTKPEQASDGIPATALGFKSWTAFAAPTLMSMFNLGSRRAQQDRQLVLSAPLLAVLGTDADSPRDWLMAGQALEALLLRARAEDVWASYFNQVVQVPELRGELSQLIGRGGYPQAVLRLGYGPEPPPTPRRVPRSLLIKHKGAHAT
jgi:hypothetical protein